MLLKGWPRILELTGRYEGEISLQANCSICLLFFRGRCLNVLVKSCKTALYYSGMRTSINYEKVIPSLCELYVFVDTLLPQQLNKQFSTNIAKCSERI